MTALWTRPCISYSQRVRIDATNVPESFRLLLPWVERYGIGDSVARTQLLEMSTLRREFVVAVSPYLENIREWAGKASYSDERYAFLCLADACDEAATDIVIHPVLHAEIERAKMKLSGRESEVRQQALCDVDRALKKLEDSEDETF